MGSSGVECRLRNVYGAHAANAGEHMECPRGPYTQGERFFLQRPGSRNPTCLFRLLPGEAARPDHAESVEIHGQVSFLGMISLYAKPFA